MLHTSSKGSESPYDTSIYMSLAFPEVLQNRFLKDRDPSESLLSSKPSTGQVFREVCFNERDSPLQERRDLVMVLCLEEDLKSFTLK